MIGLLERRGMLCPKCHNQTQVIETRLSSDGSNRRRRKCEDCEHRFTTYERIELPKLIVLKKDGSTQSFSSDKLTASIVVATQKRNINSVKINSAVEEIERTILEKRLNPVPSKFIGKLVSQILMKLDRVSYLRYTSVYKSFKSLKSFEKELNKLNK